MSILDLPTNKLELIKRLNDILRNSSDEDVKAISGALDFYAVKPIANEAKTTVDEVKHVEHAKTDKCCAFCDGDERLDPDYDDFVKIRKAAQDEDDDVQIDYAKDEETFQKQQAEAAAITQQNKAQWCQTCDSNFAKQDGLCEECYQADQADKQDPVGEVEMLGIEDSEPEAIISETNATDVKQTLFVLEPKPVEPAKPVVSSKISVCPDCGLVDSFPDKNFADGASELVKDMTSFLERKHNNCYEDESTKTAQPTESVMFVDCGQPLDKLIDVAFDYAKQNIQNKIRKALVEQVTAGGHPRKIDITFDKQWDLGDMRNIVADVFQSSKYTVNVNCDGYKNTQFSISFKQFN